MTTYAAGTRVRFVLDALGTIDPMAQALGFTDHVVGNGDEGEIMTYPGQMPDGWVAVKPDAYPDEYVPVHPDMIEVLS